MIQRILGLLSVAVAVAMLAACGGTTAGDGSEAPFDQAFIDAMVPHHRAGIEMAATALNAGLTSVELNGIARNIAESQQREIDRMLGWREEWYGSSAVEPRGGDALGMSDDEMGMTHSAMDIATATDVDGAFAAMMIDHHKGAVAMARMALEQAEHAEIKTLAQEIIAAQEREITAMQEHAAMHD